MAPTAAGQEDAFNLGRFVEAQASDWPKVCAELRAGRKGSHWMWYVFPQMKGLGSSPLAQHYGLGSLAEAKAYLAHPLLGPRLAEVTELVHAHVGHRTLHEIFGSPDDLKFRSSMTLFAIATGPSSSYARALASFCEGMRDQRTIGLLGLG